MSDRVNEVRVTVEFGFVRLVSWCERRGDELYFMGRKDTLDRYGNVIERGKPEGGAIMKLNGWNPPASCVIGEPP